uniref:Uncharacterized protein n=1 Tax=Oryza brachyantha TaxID=4533 RepID=J3MHW0_ORYBR
MPLACPLLAAGCRPPSLASSVLAASPDACRSSRQTAQVPQRPGRTFIPLYTRKQVSTERYERYREKRREPHTGWRPRGNLCILPVPRRTRPSRVLGPMDKMTSIPFL